MALAAFVGIAASALAGDGVSGIVAGVGSGGAVALRRDPDQGLRPRLWGVVIATAYTFALVRTAGAIALLSAPVFPLTALGLADHLAARRALQTSSRASSRSSEVWPGPLSTSVGKPCASSRKASATNDA
jgi:hypothetical protein